MNKINKKLYQSVAALAGFVLYLAIIIFMVRGALPLWAFVAMVAMGIIACAAFAYRTVVYCRALKEEDGHA